jgi:hypothetical protein
MKKLAVMTAALGALVAFGAWAPANAGMGQCFDAYGRPAGPPHDTDNPPYGMICAVYRAGGHCTGVQDSWAVSNCGLAPRYQYQRNYYQRPQYDYTPPYYQRQRRWPPDSDTRRNRRDGFANPHPNTPPPRDLTPGERSQHAPQNAPGN